MKKFLNALRFFTSLGIKLLIAATVMILLFVTGTTAGLRMALDIAQNLTHGAIRYEQVSGRLLGDIRLQNFVYEDQDVRVEVIGARTALILPALLMNRLRVRDLDAAEVRVAIKDSPPSDTPYLTELPFALIVDQAKVDLFRLRATAQSDWLDFRKVDLSAAWFDDVLNIDHAALDFLDFGRLQASGQLRFLPEGLRLENTQLKGPGEFVVNMTIGYDNRFELNTQWKNFRYPFTGKPLLQSATGELRAAGPWDTYDYAIKGKLHTTDIAFDVNAAGTGTLDALKFNTLSARALNGTLDASGRVQWLPQLQIDVEGHVAKLNPATRWKDWPGEINGRFALTTTMVREQPSLRFNAALAQSRLRGYALTAQARGSWRDTALQLDELQLRSGESRLWASGQALPPFDLDAKLDSPNLSQLWPALQGRANLKARLRGPLDALVVSAHGQAHEIVYETFGAQAVTLHADLDPHAASRLQLKATGVDAGVRIRSLQLQGAGNAAQHQLKLQAESAQAALQLQAEGALDLKNPNWSGSITQARIAPQGLKPWQLEEATPLRLSANDIDLQPACWRSDEGRACVQVHSKMKAGTGIAFRLDDFSLAYFRSLLPKGWSLSGRISGTGDLLARDLNSIQLAISSTEGSLSRGEQKMLQFLPGELTLGPDDGAIQARLKLPLTIGGIDAQARLAAGNVIARRALSGAIKLDFPTVDWLRLLSPEIESVAGRVLGELRLSGTAEAPQFDGTVEWQDGRIKLATPGITLAPLHLKLSGSSASTLSLNGEALSGGGSLRLQGTLDPSQKPVAVQISLSGENFQAFNTPEARIWMSPDLKLALQGRELTVGGLIKVPIAQITPTTFETGIGPSSDQIILTPAQTEETPDSPLRVRTRIQLTLGDDVKFDGFGLKTQLTGGLVATDEPGKQTTGRGEIALQGGRYKAYGQDLNIETGRLLFNDGPIIKPAVELHATRKPTEEVTVGVYVRGTLDAPQFSLYSTPAMPQERQLSWLVLGRSIDEPGSNADRAKVSDAALSLGLSGGDFLAQKIGTKVGLDSVSVGARPGQTTTQAQLTLGKYLSPKLFVSYGVGLFQPGYTFRLLYDVGHGFKLQTETGVQSGGDLLYTIER